MGVISLGPGGRALPIGAPSAPNEIRRERAEITQLFDRWTQDPVAFRLERPSSGSGLPAVGRARVSTPSIRSPATVDRMGGQMGVISDLDQTLIPVHDGDVLPKPFPGVCALLHELQGEQISGRPEAGYTHYVTARPLDATKAIPAWIDTHAFPTSGQLHSGPDKREDLEKALDKIRDISAILRADPGRGFVLFGDSSHIDPFVYQVIKQRFPDQVTAAFIHRVSDDVPPSGYPGLIVVDEYLDAAFELHALGVLDAEAVRRIGRSAELEGALLSPAQQDKLSQL